MGRKKSKKPPSNEVDDFESKIADLLLNGFTFFHVTHPKHVESIQTHGLRADADGRIFTFIAPDEPEVYGFVADAIGKNQLLIYQWALFRIDATGINGRFESDDVAEFIADFHCIIHQPIIMPSHLQFLGIRGSKPIE